MLNSLDHLQCIQHNERLALWEIRQGKVNFHAQRDWFDSHNQTKMSDEKIVKILTIFYVSNIESKQQALTEGVPSYNNNNSSFKDIQKSFV